MLPHPEYDSTLTGHLVNFRVDIKTGSLSEQPVNNLGIELDPV